MDFVRALHEWHDFFVLVGTAGATLLALMFVAASLGAGILTAKSRTATRMYMSPVVSHFAFVFLMASFGLMPSQSAHSFAALIGLTALIGIVSTAVISARLLAGFTDDIEDRLAYGVLPALGYFAALAAAVMILNGQEWSFHVLAGGLLLLVMVNIRNVWDLTLSMVRGQTTHRRK
jgi:hypothetical protein